MAEGLQSGRFRELTVLRRELKVPLEIAVEDLLRAFPPGGVAITGGTREKVDSIRTRGFLPELSAFNGIYLAANEDYVAITDSREAHRRIGEFAYTFDVVAGYAVDRGLGTQRHNQRQYYKEDDYSYDDFAIHFSGLPGGGRVSEIDYPAIAVFESTLTMKFNQIGQIDDLDWYPVSPNYVHIRYLNKTGVPAEQLVLATSLGYEELKKLWEDAINYSDKYLAGDVRLRPEFDQATKYSLVSSKSVHENPEVNHRRRGIACRDVFIRGAQLELSRKLVTELYDRYVGIRE